MGVLNKIGPREGETFEEHWQKEMTAEKARAEEDELVDEAHAAAKAT